MIRCRECEKSIGWDEAIDVEWTNKGLEYDGLCYQDKKKLEEINRGSECLR